MSTIKNEKITLEDVDMLVERLPQEHADNAKRQLRDPVLKAFDSHKSSVIYGDGNETAEEREEILSWKQSILDLDTEAFKNIPEKIKYYPHE